MLHSCFINPLFPMEAFFLFALLCCSVADCWWCCYCRSDRFPAPPLVFTRWPELYPPTLCPSWRNGTLQLHTQSGRGEKPTGRKESFEFVDLACRQPPLVSGRTAARACVIFKGWIKRKTSVLCRVYEETGTFSVNWCEKKWTNVWKALWNSHFNMNWQRV